VWVTTTDKNPTWWGDYNNVKHKRDEFFHKANLENVLCSAAGLLVMLIYWYADQIQDRRLRPRFRTLELHSYLDMQIVTGSWRLENPDPRELPKETLSAVRARELVQQKSP
jgi:hypothetical protein